MHGFLTTGMDWVSQPETSLSLPYMLSDAGFDVWLGNTRGNVFSLGNTNMSINTTQYWDAVDLDNMASKDVPSILSYVRRESNVSRVHWVGHSQGGGILIMALAKNPSLKDQLDTSVLLAPGVHMQHLHVPLLKFFADHHLDTFWNKHGFDIKGLETGKYYFPGPKFQRFMEFWTGRTPLCRISTRICNAIGKILGVNVGDPSNLDWRSMANAYKYDSGGSSFHDMMHWAQRIREDKIREFDWGSANPQHYNGSKTAPLYNLSKITGTRLAVFDGDRDLFVTQEDIASLVAEVPKENWIEHTTMKKYAHFDFVWGKDAHERLYPEVIKIISGESSASSHRADTASEVAVPIVV
jgi:pimeloyl-ACP methyl ester carboxylesterase